AVEDSLGQPDGCQERAARLAGGVVNDDEVVASPGLARLEVGRLDLHANECFVVAGLVTDDRLVRGLAGGQVLFVCANFPGWRVVSRFPLVFARFAPDLSTGEPGHQSQNDSDGDKPADVGHGLKPSSEADELSCPASARPQSCTCLVILSERPL